MDGYLVFSWDQVTLVLARVMFDNAFIIRDNVSLSEVCAPAEETYVATVNSINSVSLLL